jgi:hypothetical protein
MLPWVFAAADRFRASRELRVAAREGKFFAPQLMDEALPIALFAHSFYRASPEVEITHLIGSQPYDAVVSDRRSEPKPVTHIETTVSDFDYHEALRMELLNRDGHAPALVPVEVEGKRGARTKLEARAEAVDHDVVHARHLVAVEASVIKKTKKEYPEGTALVVRIDDSIPFRTDADRESLNELAQSILVPNVSGREFRALALVGSLGAYLAYEF